MRGTLSFTIDIINETFDTGFRKLKQTARITFIDSYENILIVNNYGVLDKLEVYKEINKNKEVNLNACYISNFSLSEYRKLYKLGETDNVQLNNFSCINSFLEAHNTIDFSYAKFTGEKVNFTQTCFGNGNLSFLKTEFGDKEVVFRDCFFGRGHSNFQYAQFGEGDIIFENTTNIGNLSFVNTHFGTGKVNFNNVHFGNGTIEFHFSRFKKGDISFDKAVFDGGRVDFRRVEFGDGKLDFRRTDFGDSNIYFDESEFGRGRKSFKRARFGKGNISFEMTNFGKETVVFENAEFGGGNISFFKSKMGELSFRSCHLNNYMDMRVESCDVLDLSNTIVRDVIDLKTGYSSVEIKEMRINGLRNLGKIILDWKENKVNELIENQKDASNFSKAEQFRILKEDFGNFGQYEDEDKAYVKFKRYELKYLHEEKLNKGAIHALYAYPVKWIQQLVFDKMGVYATNPLRVLNSMLITYVIFSLIYYLMIHTGHGELRPGFDPPENLTELEVSFYHSAITFLTIGYGDYSPWGVIRAISSIEGFVGLFLMSYFTVAFVRKILR